MYVCAICDKVSSPNEKLNKVVTQTRKKEYFDDKGKKIGSGFETIKEIGVCTKCSSVREQ